MSEAEPDPQQHNPYEPRETASLTSVSTSRSPTTTEINSTSISPPLFNEKPQRPLEQMNRRATIAAMTPNEPTPPPPTASSTEILLKNSQVKIKANINSTLSYFNIAQSPMSPGANFEQITETPSSLMTIRDPILNTTKCHTCTASPNQTSSNINANTSGVYVFGFKRCNFCSEVTCGACMAGTQEIVHGFPVPICRKCVVKYDDKFSPPQPLFRCF